MQVKFGWLGVPLFFVLSGYLLSTQLGSGALKRERVLRFWRRRFLRIYPGVWLQLAVLALAVAAGAAIAPQLSALQWGANALLLVSFPDAIAPPVNKVYWTLPIELTFYLVLPALVLMQRRLHWAVMLAGAVVLAIAWRAAVMGSHPGANMTLHLNALEALPGSLAAFVGGMAVARVPAPTAAQARLRLAAAALSLLALQYWLLVNLDTYWAGHPMLAVWNPLAGVAIALGVHALLHPPPEFNFLGSRPFVWLGETSFGIYLWHLPIFKLMLWLSPATWAGTWGSAAALALCLAATLPLAWASYRWVEKPVLDWESRRNRT